MPVSPETEGLEMKRAVDTREGNDREWDVWNVDRWRGAFRTKAVRVCNTTLRTGGVWACMHEYCTGMCVYAPEKGGLASLGASLGRTGQRYREKGDQEGAKRKLEVQLGLKSEWMLVSAKTARGRHQRNARNTKLMGSLICAGPFM